MTTETIYAVVVFEDLLTKRKISDQRAYPMQSVHEDIEMYERHNDGNKAFSFEIIGNHEQTLSRFTRCSIDQNYRRNPFNAALKCKSHDTIIIPKDPEDPRDLPWVLTFDNSQKETEWVNDIFNGIADRLYQQCCEENSEDYKIFGLLCHQGMINHVFDYHHESQMKTFRKWINQLGPVFHPDILSSFRMSYDNSIYLNNMFCSHVRKFCIYCERMFDISRYQVAKLFVKRSPEKFINKGDYTVRKAYNNNRAAAIYAENGDYETALKYYQHSVDLLKDESCQVNYQHTMDEFITYYQQNGTSVLSSKY